MTTLDEEDRREYYRIDDRIALQISPLSAAEALDPDVLQDDSPLFNLLSELHLSDFEAQHLLRQLSDKDRTLAAFLRAQNKRLDLLSAVVAQTLLGEVGHPQPVIISEGGIEFTQRNPLAPGTRVKVKMVLMPHGGRLRRRHRVHRHDRRPTATAGPLHPAAPAAATAPATGTEQPCILNLFSLI